MHPLARKQLAPVRAWGNQGTTDTMFDQYLARLPAAERLAILEAQRKDDKRLGERITAATRVFRECMTGFGETPAGPHSNITKLRERDRLYEELNGDWSWKPLRNKALGGESMKTFRGVPPSAAELYGRRSYSAA